VKDVGARYNTTQHERPITKEELLGYTSGVGAVAKEPGKGYFWLSGHDRCLLVDASPQI
jgi:hypothetical protein